MPHINELIDYAADALIVFQDKVLLIHHRKHDMWLPVGGHIELDEDPEQALFREVKEECGLEVEIIGRKPNFKVEGTKSLHAPVFMNIHDISTTHRHVGLYYVVQAKTDKCVLNDKEHKDIKWFTREDLQNPEYDLDPAVKFYAEEALKIAQGK